MIKLIFKLLGLQFEKEQWDGTCPQWKDQSWWKLT